MKQYKLSKNINPDKIFITNFSQLRGRVDAQYYKELSYFDSFCKLSDFAFVKGGKRIPLGYSYSNEVTPYLYLRVSDINDDNTINFSDLHYIDEKIFNILQRYEIKKNDLAMSIAGTIGKTVLFHTIPANKKVILTENCAKFILKDTTFLPQYFQLVLNLSIVKKQIDLNYVQTTIPKLGLDKIKNLMLPKPPDKNIQQKIINFYQKAYEKKQQKEAKANALLASIDDYLLKELGIKLPKKDNSLKNRIFITRFKELISGRLDPKYNKNILFFIKSKGKYPSVLLQNILLCKPQYGANETAKNGNCNKDARYIRITDIDEYGILKNDDWKTAEVIEDKYLLNINDLLFARSGSVGRCYIHKNTERKAIFAGYLIRFVTNENLVLPDYIFFYCNSAIYKYWVDTIHRPAVQSNINSKEYLRLPIILPPIEKQKEIASHIQKIRTEAKKLQEEAQEILETAKKEIEAILLGKKTI